MILINEWLPNPVGSDAQGEWIELRNTSPNTASLQGWRIENASGKKFLINQTIVPDGYLLLPRSETKLMLRNSGEDLKLFDAQGVLVDHSNFLGAVPEGKSVGRLNNETVLLAPSPGTANTKPALQYPTLDYPLHTPLRPISSSFSVIGLALGTALFLTLVVVFLKLHIHDEAESIR